MVSDDGSDKSMVYGFIPEESVQHAKIHTERDEHF